MLSATAQETSLGKQCKAKAAEPEAITVVDTIEVAHEGELGMLEDGFKAGGKSCAEASLDENIPKMTDLAAATAPAAVTVVSDLSAFYKPSASAVFWSKFAHDHPADGPHAGAIMGALKNDILAAIDERDTAMEDVQRAQRDAREAREEVRRLRDQLAGGSLQAVDGSNQIPITDNHLLSTNAPTPATEVYQQPARSRFSAISAYSASIAGLDS